MKTTLIKGILAYLLLHSTAFAGDAAPDLDKADRAFIIMATAMVFFMQAGFCLLEMGFSRAKNAINIVMKNVCDMSAGVLGFFVIGFGLMFGVSQGGFIGTGSLAFTDIELASPVWVFFIFQAVFAATTVTISSGAMAERTYFPGYLIYAVVACAVIYPIIGHWAWGGAAEPFGFGSGQGWLAKLGPEDGTGGFSDFAGSAVVHCMGGAFALAGIIVIGPRKGRFLEDGSERIFPGHNIPLGALGLFILFFGWFGFNCGSLLSAGEEIGVIAVNTVLAGAAALVSGMLFHWMFRGWADPESAINGGLGGLVGITACCNVVTPLSSIIIGLICGFIVVVGGRLLLKLRLDDAVGAVPVHLFCGVIGVLSVSIFNKAEPFANLVPQVIGALVIPASAFILSWVVFQIINKTIGLRATDDAQDMGLDFAEHSANAYPDFQSNEET